MSPSFATSFARRRFVALRRIAPPALLTLALFAGCMAPVNNGDPASRGPTVKPDAAADLADFSPEWAADAPHYSRPADEPNPDARAEPREPLHFYLNRRLLQIRRPSTQDADETPRIALFATTDDAASWHRIGYFGRGQTFFPFEVAADGDYGIRFVGPQQPAARDLPAVPDRVYHVDATPPEVVLTMEPSDATSAVGEVPVAQRQAHVAQRPSAVSPAEGGQATQDRTSAVGQTVTVGWTATDRHLLDRPVQVSVAGDADEWRVLASDQSADGSLAYTIPAAARGHAVRFRIEAIDRANNVGMAFSPALAILESEKPAELAAAMPIEPSAAPMTEPAQASAESRDQGAPSENFVSLPAPCEPDVWTVRDLFIPSSLIPLDETATDAVPVDANTVLLETIASTDTAAAPCPDDDAAPLMQPPSDNAAPDSVPAASVATTETDPPAPVTATIANPSAPVVTTLTDTTAPASAANAALAAFTAAPARTDHRMVLAADVLRFMPEDQARSHDQPIRLVPPLPVFDSTGAAAPADTTADADRPWQVLRRADAPRREVVWSLPRPKFLSQLAKFIDMQWQRANPTDLAAAPAANEPGVARAGPGDAPPPDGPTAP